MSKEYVNSFIEDENENIKKEERINVRIGPNDVPFFKDIKQKAEENIGRPLSNSAFVLRLLDFYNYATFKNDFDETSALEKISQSNRIDKKLNFIDLNTNKNLRLAITILQNIGLKGLDNTENKQLIDFIEKLDDDTEASEISEYLSNEIDSEIHRNKLRKK